MKLIDSISRMSTLVKIIKKEGKSIGFVPTMGYLHEGHISLIKTAKQHADVVVVSIFVNPIQFSPGEDFDKYPRDIKRDENLARDAGADIIFYPVVKEMYQDGYATYVNVERLTDGLCGKKRPGHFRGVTTVVAKLFGIVKPDIAYFGQKDAQQAFAIKKMVEDLNMGIEIKILPTVRAEDGLAMSSRNTYLTESDKRDAALIYDALEKAEAVIREGETDPAKVVSIMAAIIGKANCVKIDYMAITDTKELREVKKISGEVLVAAAVYVGKTRLIDNIIVNASLNKAPVKKGVTQ